MDYYRGKPIQELTKEELIEALVVMYKSLQEQRESSNKIIDVLKGSYR